MSGLPTVSVIIPSHNCLTWLPRAIASAGPRRDIEIIVLDDASTDGTAQWLEYLADEDDRVVLLAGQGLGPSKARNRAIKIARGKYLAFLDADDIWYPGKLTAQLGVHEAWPEVGFSFTDYRHVTETGDDFGNCFEYWSSFRRRVGRNTAPFPLGGDALAVLFAENVVGTSTVMARTDLVRSLGGFSEDMPSAEDWDLWLRLARRAPVMCIPDVMADYTIHRAGSITSKLRTRLLATRMIGARHQDAVRQISASAVRTFMSRMMEADAEIAAQAGEPWGNLGCRVAAFAWAPSGRGAREIVHAACRVAVSRRSAGVAAEHGAAALPVEAPG